ncbi:hypothetical protein P6U16_07360 [Rhizobium sp. 32-5/1]|uniref:hypothetical protein n=1 Tax=Rhizobium sp. 32-5/1 TaxID=3019602 RepID=UPI00240D1151|nr:hypothetical protein [Rhizobium sp. 32-5/1]WEZ84435.1 hypothetical protein P6U16_07360 [Rhizobium sp. 32-5/1]
MRKHAEPVYSGIMMMTLEGEWTMIVLGLCAMLIATLTLAAVSMLLNIEDENKAATPRIF